MDRYGLAGDLLDERYQDPAFIRENISYINDLVAVFVPQLTQQEAFAGAQELGFPWGAVRTPDELLEDPHLIDRQFWFEVEHPELGRSFIYTGGAAIYGKTPWRISRRAPLLGEHNEEVLRGELGLPLEELSLLGEWGVV